MDQKAEKCSIYVNQSESDFNFYIDTHSKLLQITNKPLAKNILLITG